ARGPRGRAAELPVAARRRVSARPVRVVLVEDNETFRETLELLFALRDEIEVVASIGTGDQAPPIVADMKPDVVLMDYRMPGLNGAEATRAVLEAYPGTSVVCLTASVSTQEIREVLEAGAVACGTKDEDFTSSWRRSRRRRPHDAHSREHRGRARLDGGLPGGAPALPELPCRAALRAVRHRELPGLRRHHAGPLLRAAARRTDAADHVA